MYRFVGPPVFCRYDPAGKPANNSSSAEPQNEFNQFHFFSPFRVFHNPGFSSHGQDEYFIELTIL
jgi:hypothetical protein